MPTLQVQPFPLSSIPFQTSLNMLGLARALPLPVLTALDPSTSASSKGQFMPKSQGLATTDSNIQSKNDANFAKQISPSLNQPHALPTASADRQVSGIPYSPALRKRVKQTAVVDIVVSPLSSLHEIMTITPTIELYPLIQTVGLPDKVLCTAGVPIISNQVYSGPSVSGKHQLAQTKPPHVYPSSTYDDHFQPPMQYKMHIKIH